MKEPRPDSADPCKPSLRRKEIPAHPVANAQRPLRNDGQTDQTRTGPPPPTRSSRWKPFRRPPAKRTP